MEKVEDRSPLETIMEDILSEDLGGFLGYLASYRGLPWLFVGLAFTLVGAIVAPVLLLCVAIVIAVLIAVASFGVVLGFFLTILDFAMWLSWKVGLLNDYGHECYMSFNMKAFGRFESLLRSLDRD